MKLAASIDDRGRPLAAASVAVTLAPAAPDQLPWEVPDGTLAIPDRAYNSDPLL